MGRHTQGRHEDTVVKPCATVDGTVSTQGAASDRQGPAWLGTSCPLQPGGCVAVALLCDLDARFSALFKGACVR
jgi:hypothetical protein